MAYGHQLLSAELAPGRARQPLARYRTTGRFVVGPPGQRAGVTLIRLGQISSLRSRNSSLNCQPSKAATMRPSSSQDISRPSMTTIGTR